jgi:hypothetical protein
MGTLLDPEKVLAAKYGEQPNDMYPLPQYSLGLVVGETRPKVESYAVRQESAGQCSPS